MSQIVITAKFFWAALIEGGLLIAVTGLTVFMAQLDKLGDDSVHTWGWVSWSKFAGPICLAMAIQLKGFLSDSMARAKQKQTDATSFLIKGNE